MLKFENIEIKYGDFVAVSYTHLDVYKRQHRVYEYGEYHDHEYYDKKAGIWYITGCGYDK